jgi:hypothetical protein
MAREERGKIVGRRRVSDVKFLRILAVLGKMGGNVYLLGKALSVLFRRACDIIEERENTLRPCEHRRHCIMPL